jgi:hypothetical protein
MDFDAFYASVTPPWDVGRPQPAFLALAEASALRGGSCAGGNKGGGRDVCWRGGQR